MSLKCNKCDGRNTKVVPAEKMSEFSGKGYSTNSAAGTILLSPEIITLLISGAIEILKSIFEFLTNKKNNNGNVVVCLDCGHWERV